MNSNILEIKNKNRTPANTLTKLEDFDYLEKEPIDPKIILEKPNISLYCLDFENKRAIFVETSVDIESLSQEAFFYHAQYKQAERLLAVSFEDLAKLIPRIEPIKDLVIIYSVGRCGSTLLSKVFDRVDSVLSLSEPDVFSQLVGMRNPDRSNDEQVAQLLKICLSFITRSTQENKHSGCVIKLRSFCIELADLFYKVAPHAKVLFLYRNAEDVIKSSMRAFVFVSKMLPTLKDNIDTYSRIIPLLKEYQNDIDFNDERAIDLYTVLWLSEMQKYLEIYDQNIPTCAVRYEDLIAQPEQIVAAIFEKCNLPIDRIKEVCQVFEKDSQSGSNLSRENTYKNQTESYDNEEINHKIANLLNKHPKIKASDFIVPGTLKSGI